MLQLQQDILLGQASFTSVREYVLSQPVVSFVPAGLVLPVEGGAEEELGLGEGAEDPPEPRDKPFDCRKDVVTIRLYCIQTRCVVVCYVKAVVAVCSCGLVGVLA